MSTLADGAKLYCRIGEVARLTGLKPSIIRFWETEFPGIAPHKSSTGQRLYSQQNIKEISAIKELLYTEKLTIAGAKNRLRQARKSSSVTSPDTLKQILISELLAIKKILSP
jgi:DNA-binding transcriptional MerR regulator